MKITASDIKIWLDILGLQEICIHLRIKSDLLIHLLLLYIMVHDGWRLNATKYILDIEFSTQMYMCISGRCRLKDEILFLPLSGRSLLSDKFII